MNNRERTLAVLNYQSYDRLPIAHFGFWDETLEKWARELSCTRCILETGKRQPEAIGLYKRNGYRLIPNYGQYAAVENSVCFEKELK